ncbi:Threonyl and Alanyl tRNA synthetase second additional domain protein [compost metagenome]
MQISSITDAELDANPALVKSMSVQPPRGSGRVRTVRIGGDGTGEMPAVDFQPCGGTHLANTSEIGAIAISKTEKKGANSPRVILAFAP